MSENVFLAATITNSEFIIITSIWTKTLYLAFVVLGPPAVWPFIVRHHTSSVISGSGPLCTARLSPSHTRDTGHGLAARLLCICDCSWGSILVVSISMLDTGCPKNTVFLANDHNFQMNDSWFINNKDFMQLKSGISEHAIFFARTRTGPRTILELIFCVVTISVCVLNT